MQTISISQQSRWESKLLLCNGLILNVQTPVCAPAKTKITKLRNQSYLRMPRYSIQLD